MNLEQINAKLKEIRTKVNSGDLDEQTIEALTNEARDLIAQRDSLQDLETRRQQLRQLVAGGEGTVVRTGPVAAPAAPAEQRGADSPEYRSAFLLNLLGRGDEMTAEQRAAFTHTTANTPNVLPTTMLNTIWDLVSKEHSIMGDITIYRTGTILEVVKHTAIAAGAAKTVAENAANDDEQNTFVKVTLTGKDFSKHLEISYAMERMSIDALESYLVSEISRGLGEAMAVDVVTTIQGGINAANKVTTTNANEVAFKDVTMAFGQLARVGGVTVYGTRKTIYNYLVGMVDANGVPIFQPNAQKGAEGSILGALIKVEDAVADGKLLIGDPRKVLYNMIQDILLEKDRDIKTHKIIHSGYARGEGTLIDDKAFVELTVKPA